MTAKAKTFKGRRVGLFVIDPGSTTGLMGGYLTVKGSTEEIFAKAKMAVHEIDCNDQTVPPQRAEVAGIQTIVEMFVDWNRICLEKSIPIDRRICVIEDFVLRETGIGSTNREGLSPVRVTSGLHQAAHDWPGLWVYQSPSDAKNTVTNDRLRNLGLWVRGMEHGRDASRHAALWVKRQM